MKNLSAIGVMLLAALAVPSLSFAIEDSNQGVVVERVAKGSEADLAGLREGDTIQTWTRGEARGAIQSPFDLSALEIEQAPRGEITLRGTRETSAQTWKLGAGKWSIETRPVLPESVLLQYRQGQESARSGKLDEAAERWGKAAIEVATAQPSWLGPWFSSQLAKLMADAGRWKEADAAYQAALKQAAGAGSTIEVELLRTWALTYEQRADWRHGEKYNRQAVTESQRSGPDTLLTAWCLFGLGHLFWLSGDLPNAQKYLGEALEIRSKQAPGSLAVAAVLNNLGLVSEDRGNLEDAERYLTQSLEIREKLAPDSLEVAASLNNLGSLEEDRDLDRAEQYDLRSLAIKERLAPGSLDVAYSYSALGNVAFSRGDLSRAETYFTKALEIRKRLSPGSPEIAANFSNLGSVKWERGDLAAAEEYYREALAIEQKFAPGSLDTANILDNLGNVALSRRDLASARTYHDQALQIRKKLAPVSLDTGRSFDNLGDLAEAEGDLASAASYYRRALILQEKLVPDSLIVAVSLSDLGGIAARHSDWESAERYYSRALAIQLKLAPDSLETAETFRQRGDIARKLNNLVLAEERYRKALAIQEKLAPESAPYAESLAALGSIMRSQGRSSDAAKLFEQSLNALENQIMRLGGSEDIRSDFRARYARYYSEYIDLLMRQNQTDLAFHVAERRRARSLLETLAAARADIHSGANPDLLERERSLQDSLRAKSDRRVLLLTGKHTDGQIESVEKEIATLRAEYQQVEEKIRASSPVYAALTQPQSLTVKDVQQLLDEDTLLIEYSLGEERSYLWTLTSTGFAAHELPGRSRIEANARRLYKIVSTWSSSPPTDGPPETQRQHQLSALADATSRMILGPIAEQLQGKRLLIVADGALQYVPFALLRCPGKAGTGPLILEHEIVYLPSALVLAELRREANGRKPPAKAVAVLADPVFDKEDPRVQAGHRGARRQNVKLPTRDATSLFAQSVSRSAADVGLSHLSRLAFSRREADAIIAATPAGQGLEALGFDASRRTATSRDLAQYRIVHFATHGLWDNRRPEFSGLVLSLVDQQGRPQNGFLDLQDIYNLNLAADLVVLSACDTALGREVQGEGLIGVTRGFMYAGATRVVASLWNVDDSSTKELMESFYRAMEQQGMRPAAALRAAQITMWKQQRWREPYYWAAFQIQGEWK